MARADLAELSKQAHPALLRHRVRVLGEGTSTLFLAHGFGTDQTAWTQQISAFESGRRIVLFDHVGVSPSNAEGFSPLRYTNLFNYANDIIDVARALDLRGATFIGHSVSGMLGMLVSILEPDLFSRLIVIGASPRYLDDADSGYHGGFSQAQLDELFARMSSSYYVWASGFAPLVMGRPDRPDLAQHYVESVSAIRPDIAQAVLRVVFHSDHREELPYVPVPVFVLQSDGDIAVPTQVGSYIARHIPRATLVRLSAQGHLPHISSPNVVNEAIRACLSD